MRPSSFDAIVGFILGLASTFTHAQASNCEPSLPLPIRTVYQFSKPTYLQCTYLRSNGDILLGTVFPNASIYYLSGAHTNSPKVRTIQTWAGIPTVDDQINAVTAITETQPNVFVFTAGIQQELGLQINGTWGLWTLDLRPTLGPRPGKPVLKELVHIPDSGLLSSMVALPGKPTTVLVADTSLGHILRIDTLTRKWEVAISDGASMHYPPWASLQFGVNGLAIHGDYLYWTNSFVATIYRIRITKQGYVARGAIVEHFVSVRSLFLDATTFGPGDKDTLWVGTNADNRVLAIGPDANITTVAGAPDEMVAAGAVAPSFGRVRGDTHTLYVATSGGVVLPVNGTEFEGGKVLALDTRGFFRNC